jgi:16S rRNA (uracil1498-N3)-methyltransferase
MQLFYSNQIVGNEIVMGKSDSQHCIRTLRKKIGDQINIVDGMGTYYRAEITHDSASECTLNIIETKSNFDKRNYYIHIAIAPTKSHDRLEWFVEKAVEIGVDEISFIQTSRTERKKIRLDRIEKIAITAMKQTVKATLPKLNELQNFNSFISKSHKNNLFIAHLDESKRESINTHKITENSSLVLIGPEGDFTPAEIDLAVQNNFMPISLGKSRLRTETAGVVACHLLNIKFED